MHTRIGFGTDYHQLVAGRKLWLGGIEVPHEKGALGHSDADVLLHAICDALLGAASLGDIGKHFPDTDQAYKNADSKILLASVRDLVRSAGYSVQNVDATLCLERPKISPYVSQMREAIGNILGVGAEAVSLKATTTEKLGFVGREEGVLASAVALLIKDNPELSILIVNTSGHPLPSYSTTGSSGMDLRAHLDAPVTLKPLERTLIPTGIFIAIPEGYEVQVRPRSGLAIKQGLTCLNTPGTIDADYRGEIKVILVNLSAEEQTIAPGDRIAQMVLQQVSRVAWQQVEKLDETVRGAGGFGHTGTT